MTPDIDIRGALRGLGRPPASCVALFDRHHFREMGYVSISKFMMMIVPIYGSSLGLLFVGLSWRTLSLRRKHKVGVGDGNNKELVKAIRAHANNAEYVPLCLILLYALEQEDAYPAVFVHGLCTALCIGRFLHAYGVSQVAETYRYRVIGTALTLSTLTITSCLLLVGSWL